ncbi:MAG: hypothetical protein JXB45_00385 [Candidatus Krumholzibacteriota bacterium]|nr:hypothetical protein [Candidatus Krumholzibacteriota bacterium]
MKKVILFVVAIALLMGNAQAMNSYIGLFRDEERTDFHYFGAGQFDVWVWHYPGSDGMMSAEFAMTYPPDCCQIGWEVNPDYKIIFQNPTFPNGGAITFETCAYDWKWSYKLTVLAASPDPGIIKVVPNPHTGKILYAACTTGFPTYEPIIYTWFCVNYFCYIDVEETSWGAIKSMYNE